ncbi:MAG: OmpA family protein [Rhodobacter sp.]|nr:OmpA family protein [Rhodobacter sp.]
MAKRSTPLLAAASLLALTACSDSEIFSSWTQPAGEFLDEGGFGNPTMNNVQIHNGEKQVLIDLNSRFQREVTPVVTFDFNSARLDGNARAILRRQAHWIRQFPEIRFRVYGHTDLVGSEGYNKRLGQRRANAVVAFLARQGVSRSRLEAVVSFGETQPVVATTDRERRNRRAVTEVSGFIRTHPTLLNGKYAEVIFREYVESATEAPPRRESGLEVIAGQGQ